MVSMFVGRILPFAWYKRINVSLQIMFLAKDVLLLSIQQATAGITTTVHYLTNTPTVTPDIVPDIVARVTVIEALIRESNPTQPSQRLALKYVRETIQDLQRELIALKNAVDDHEQRWFASWRSLDVVPFRTKLQHLRHILDERMQLYTQVQRFST